MSYRFLDLSKGSWLNYQRIPPQRCGTVFELRELKSFSIPSPLLTKYKIQNTKYKICITKSWNHGSLERSADSGVALWCVPVMYIRVLSAITNQIYDPGILSRLLDFENGVYLWLLTFVLPWCYWSLNASIAGGNSLRRWILSSKFSTRGSIESCLFFW